VRVLLVAEGSDTAHSTALVDRLRASGHTTSLVHTRQAALAGAAGADLVLLDLELTDRDALELCRDLSRADEVAVICYTRQPGELDRVLALQAGSDDCLVRPFGMNELTARIEAVTRRVHPRHAPGSAAVLRGALRLDRRSRQVLLSGRPIAVTRAEFDLLLLLAAEPDGTVPRGTALERIRSGGSARPGRTLDTHVSSLRRKLGAKSWIVTVHGVGLRLGHGPED